jgi:hypothetical protein
MAFQQIQQFGLKIPMFVVLILIANICNDCRLICPAYAECGVSFLPAKPSAVWKGLANPARGICLERIYQVGDSDGGWQGYIQMDMIRLAVDFNQPCVLGARNRTDIGMEALSPLPVNEISAPFGAPDNVQKYGKKFSGHILFNRPGCKLIEKICQFVPRLRRSIFMNPQIPALRPGLATSGPSGLILGPRGFGHAIVLLCTPFGPDLGSKRIRACHCVIVHALRA